MSNLLTQIYVKLKTKKQFWLRHEKRSQRCENSTSLLRFYLTISQQFLQGDHNTIITTHDNKAYVRFFRAGST